MKSSYEDDDIAILIGLTLDQINGATEGSSEIVLSVGDRTFRMYHRQDCCESVSVNEIIGDVNDLLHTPILHAYGETNHDPPPEHVESFTWTFYRLATIKGTVTLRWLGASNGYYSERVSFVEDK